jgi:hypothetical protein
MVWHFGCRRKFKFALGNSALFDQFSELLGAGCQLGAWVLGAAKRMRHNMALLVRERDIRARREIFRSSDVSY